jgi:hypothetical protein
MVRTQSQKKKGKKRSKVIKNHILFLAKNSFLAKLKIKKS